MARKAPAQDLDLEFEEEAGEQTGPRPGDWVMLVLRAASRRKVLFLAVFVMGCAAVAGYYRLKRPVYRVEAKILTQRGALPANLHSGADDNPVRTAWELIHRRDNLLALIQSAKLMDPAGPSADPGTGGVITGIKTKVGLIHPGDPLDDMVTALDKRLVVTADEGTINIRFDWGDPQRAYAVVEGALQNFIEARHVQEVTAIDEVLSVLRARAAKEKESLDLVIEQVRREQVQGYRDASPSAPALPTRTVKGPSDELIRLKSLLEGKARAIQDVEEFRRRRLADLHAQLDEKRNTYSDAHPSVIQLKQDIESLSKESTQVSALQDEEAKLRKQYLAQLAQEGLTESSSGPVAPPPPPVRAGTPQPRVAHGPVEDDERVRDARFQYQQIVERVNSAQLELDAVRAAFKYRYNVVWPPQIPRDPVSPNPVKTFGAGILAALFLACLAAAAPDIHSGRIVERWQVERTLGLTVLAEIRKR